MVFEILRSFICFFWEVKLLLGAVRDLEFCLLDSIHGSAERMVEGLILVVHGRFLMLKPGLRVLLMIFFFNDLAVLVNFVHLTSSGSLFSLNLKVFFIV